MNSEKQFANLGYKEAGSGQPVVFLHGLGYDARIWAPFFQELVPNVRCIAIDLPGHGASKPLVNALDYDCARIADLLHAFLEGIGAGNPVIVGHSIGAAQATFHAAKYATKAVLNLDQTFQFEPLARSIQSAAVVLQGTGFPDFWADFRGSWGLDSLPAPYKLLEEKTCAPKQDIVLAYWDIFFRMSSEEVQRYVEEAIAGVSVPWVAYHGGYLDPDYEAWLGKRISTARLVYRPNSGHFPHFVHFEEVADLIRELSGPG